MAASNSMNEAEAGTEVVSLNNKWPKVLLYLEPTIVDKTRKDR